MKQVKDIWWSFADSIYPSAIPFTQEESKIQIEREEKEIEECKKRIASLPDSELVLNKHLSTCLNQLDKEETRRQSVEARLTTIIGLSSIAGTVAFGGLVAEASGTLRPPGALLKWLIALGAFYLILQLCCGILAAVRGLSRQSYMGQKTADILPETTETRSAYLRRQIDFSLRSLADHRSNNNKRVTEMAIAHRSMKNFVVGLIIVCALIFPFSVTSNPADYLTEELKRNHELSELLRGPQGPQGPQGLRGPQGPKGDSQSNLPKTPKASK